MFVDEHRDWAKWRTWSDHTTHLIHESQTLRAELVHEPDAREAAWTFAAYETPVSDRMWHLTLTAAVPGPLLRSLLISLAHGDAWDTALGSPVIERTVSAATRPLTDAGWKHTIDTRHIRRQTAQGDAGVQFDVFAAQDSRMRLTAWTLWAGPDTDRPTWAIHASRHTPAPLLTALTEDLAHSTGTRTAPLTGPPRRAPQDRLIRSPAHSQHTPDRAAPMTFIHATPCNCPGGHRPTTRTCHLATPTLSAHREPIAA